MAVLAITSKTERAPMGPYFMQAFTVTTGIAQAAQWIPTGMNKIHAVLGSVILGTAAGAGTTNFVKNAQGSGETEDTAGGDLGIEATAALVVEVTVIGD